MVWDLTQEIHLQPGIPDQHHWLPSALGSYSAKSAYDRFHAGLVTFEHAKRIWKCWATYCCKFFLSGWLLFTDIG